MRRVLRWVGVLALLSIPIIAFVGRTGRTGCEHTTTPCDPLPVEHAWQTPAALAALCVGILALVAAASWSHLRDGNADT